MPAELILSDTGVRSLVEELDERHERVPSMLSRLEVALERFGDRPVLLVLQPQEPAGVVAESANELYDLLVAGRGGDDGL
jgi:hypothetical protein